MPLFWTIWAGVVVAILLLASWIEISGARNGFVGANGIFLFTSGYLTVLSSPILFIVSWIWRDFLTALIVWGIGAVAYVLLFKGMLNVIDRMTRKEA